SVASLGLQRRIASAVPKGISIENHRHDQRPQSDADEQGAIREEGGGGISPLPPLVHQVEIAKNAVKDERNGNEQMTGPKLLLHLRRDGVERIADHRRGGGDGDHLVQEANGVLLQCGPVLLGPLREQLELPSALAEGQKKGEEDGA